MHHPQPFPQQRLGAAFPLTKLLRLMESVRPRTTLTAVPSNPFLMTALEAPGIAGEEPGYLEQWETTVFV